MGEPNDPDDKSSLPPQPKDERENTWAVPPAPARSPFAPRIEMTQPTESMRTRGDVTRPTEVVRPGAPSRVSEVTRPTIAYPKDALRAVPPNRAAGRTPAAGTAVERKTGSVPALRRTGEVAALRKTGSTAAVRRTGEVPALRRTGTVPAARRTGTVPAARRTGTVPRYSGSTNPAIRPELMTEGMKAHRREIERKKRRAAIERMREQADVSEGWQRVWRTVGLLVLGLSLCYGYWRVQQAYGNRWPLMAVWMMISVSIVAGFGWILWYTNKSDI